MSSRSLQLNDSLYQYLLTFGVNEHPALASLRERTAALPDATMQISPEQGQLMQLLLRLIGAQKTLEIGVYTGYSSLCCALALPAHGQHIALDINEEWTAIGKQAWAEAGIADKIDLRLNPAIESLSQLIESGEAENFDFVFIDADKENYLHYYELSLQLLRPGGLMAIDNTLWGGAVIDETDKRSSTCAIRQLNETILNDLRVESSLVPIGDGLFLVRKKEW